MRTVGGMALCALAACEGTLPPLRGQMEVGRDAYAVFVAGKGKRVEVEEGGWWLVEGKHGR